jgi:antitoxin (DNA-binding transcriptional repressor) of toxin-antitoxin stability system
MMTRKIDVVGNTDLKACFALVAEGSEVILTEGDTLLARLMPVGGRIAGLHRGGIWVGADFDEPLPEEFWPGGS